MYSSTLKNKLSVEHDRRDYRRPLLWTLVIFAIISTSVRSLATPSQDKKSDQDQHSLKWSGEWRGENLRLLLGDQGQAELFQSGVSDQMSSKSINHLIGFWWLREDQLCLSFDLISQCIPLIQSQANAQLKLLLGRQIISFKRSE